MLDLTAASIRSNAKYKGGLIGFVLVPNPNGTGAGAAQYHYTEHRFNVYCSKCTTPGPWYFDADLQVEPAREHVLFGI